MASVTFGPSCEGRKKSYPKDFHQISVCISLAITLAIHDCLHWSLSAGGLCWMQFWTIRILLTNRKQSLDVEYVTNYTHYIPLLNSLFFHVDLFVYLITLHTGQLLPSFHDLSQMRFLYVVSSNSSIRMDPRSMWPVLNVWCPFFTAGALWGWIELGNLYR